MVRKRIGGPGTVRVLDRPVALSVAAGVTRDYFIGWRSVFTVQWIAQVWELYRGTVWLSLLIAGSCVAVTLVTGVPLAYALVRSGTRWARLIEETITLPVAIPGLAIALALIESYGAAGEFRRSWTFILVGARALHAAVHGALGRRGAGFDRSRGPRGERREPGRALRAALSRRRAAQCRAGILAGTSMVSTLSVGEFNLTWMLHTPLTATLPVGLADAYASMRLEIASAYTLVFFVMIVPVLIAMQLAARRMTA